MATTCFFCQNLLSDYIEGILPAHRHQDIRDHLAKCPACEAIHHDLLASMKRLEKIQIDPISPQFSARIAESAEAAKHHRSRPQILKRATSFVFVFILGTAAIISLSARYPKWLREMTGERLFSAENRQEKMVKYFPLAHGATEILEEQSNWVNNRGSQSGGLWDEGGLPAEEFEKSFQKRGAEPEEAAEKF